MRTTFLLVVAVLAAVLLVSATVWEGVSDVSAPRDLPRAYSVATNSFPRNTVVDITNLENGKMVRVIVIANLETTGGLLATLSHNAADAIDLRHDSTCRIRMNQSSDNAPPRARGTPAPHYQLGPIDASGAVLASTAEEEAPASSATTANRSTPAQSVATTERPAATETVATASKPVPTESATTTSKQPTANNVTTTSKPVPAESTTTVSKPVPAESTTTVSKPIPAENTATTSKPAATENTPLASKSVATETVPVASKPAATQSATTASKPAATETVPVASKPASAESAAPTQNTTTASKPVATEIAPVASKPALTMISVEEPEAKENDIIAADESAVADDAIAVSEPIVTDNVIAADEPVVTNNVIVADEAIATDVIVADGLAMTDNIVAADSPTVIDAKPQPEPRIVSGTLTLIPAEERVPTATEESAVAASRDVAPKNTVSKNAPHPVRIAEPAYTLPAEFSPFQAPLISSLERGKWYVQLGVYSRPDNVEDEISRIGTAYPVAIQNVGNDTSPMFRILLGPLNQGESGAMLQRFKSIGYADAFIRHN